MYEVLFQYGPLTLRTFNFFLAGSLILAMYFLVRYVGRSKLSLSFLSHTSVPLILISLLGGRIFYIFEHLSTFKESPLEILRLWDMNYSPFGMVYTGLLCLFIFTYREKEDFWAWLDGFTLATLIGLFVVHIGYFFDGSHYGKPTELPWGIQFDAVAIPFTSPIHPTQLYSALAAFVVYGFMMKLSRRTHLSGLVGSLGILIYALSAFGIDFLHGSESTYVKINTLALAALGFIFYIHSSHKTHVIKS